VRFHAALHCSSLEHLRQRFGQPALRQVPTQLGHLHQPLAVIDGLSCSVVAFFETIFYVHYTKCYEGQALVVKCGVASWPPRCLRRPRRTRFSPTAAAFCIAATPTRKSRSRSSANANGAPELCHCTVNLNGGRTLPPTFQRGAPGRHYCRPS